MQRRAAGVRKSYPDRRDRGAVWRLCRRVCSPPLAVFGTFLLGATLAVCLSGCDDADTIFVPVVYVVAGRVVDPTTSPIDGVPQVRVVVETAPSVGAVISDANGDFILQGVPPGTHRLSAELPGHVTTLTYDFAVTGNVVDVLVPTLTPGQVDSVLDARGAPIWNRGQALFGLFALKSTGVPLGDATVTFTPSPGGTLVQTGEGADPIVVVNAASGTWPLTVTRTGYVWDGPHNVTLRPGVLTFAAPRARPNFNGFLFAHDPGGAPIADATVNAVRSQDDSFVTTTTTNFIGQFSLVGLPKDTYDARWTPSGFLPGRSVPQPLDQDTTFAAVAFAADSIVAWAAAAGVDSLVPGAGMIVFDVRNALTGERIDGATVEVIGGAGRSVPGSARSLPMRVDLPPGLYRAFARAPGPFDGEVQEDVRVASGEVTFGTTTVAFVLPVRK